MKLSRLTVVRRVTGIAVLPINFAIDSLNMLIRFYPASRILVRFLAGRPKWFFQTYRDLKHVGLYRFTDRKGCTLDVLLIDSQADSAINNPNNHAARQFVLDEIHRVIRTTDRRSDFAAPSAIYLWRQFSHIERVRDASDNERRRFSRPIRDGLSEYFMRQPV